MPILDHWNLQLTVDDVIRAQGADPVALRARRPGLIKKTEHAIDIAQSLLHPVVLYEKYLVKKFVHEKLELSPLIPDQGRYFLTGSLISQHLASSQFIIAMICTIGREFDESVSNLFNVDPVIGYALDGVGSAAVELLAIQASNYFENQAEVDGLKTSMPLNPGMVGWPVQDGQPEIFVLLNSEEIQVSMTDSYMMVPNKSLSIVMGLGTNLSQAGSSCDYCSLKGVCRYQNHYA